MFDEENKNLIRIRVKHSLKLLINFKYNYGFIIKPFKKCNNKKFIFLQKNYLNNSETCCYDNPTTKCQIIIPKFLFKLLNKNFKNNIYVSKDVFYIKNYPIIFFSINEGKLDEYYYLAVPNDNTLIVNNIIDKLKQNDNFISIINDDSYKIKNWLKKE